MRFKNLIGIMICFIIILIRVFWDKLVSWKHIEKKENDDLRYWSIPIKAKSRKIKTSFTLEVAEDIRKMKVDENALAQAMADEIRKGIRTEGKEAYD